MTRISQAPGDVLAARTVRFRTASAARRRAGGRGDRGVTGQTAVSAYNRGNYFFDPDDANYIRFDRQSGIAWYARAASTALLIPSWSTPTAGHTLPGCRSGIVGSRRT